MKSQTIRRNYFIVLDKKGKPADTTTKEGTCTYDCESLEDCISYAKDIHGSVVLGEVQIRIPLGHVVWKK